MRILFVLLLGVALFACKKEEPTPEPQPEPIVYDHEVKFVITSTGNFTTDMDVTIGHWVIGAVPVESDITYIVNTVPTQNTYSLTYGVNSGRVAAHLVDFSSDNNDTITMSVYLDNILIRETIESYIVPGHSLMTTDTIP